MGQVTTSTLQVVLNWNNLTHSYIHMCGEVVCWFCYAHQCTCKYFLHLKILRRNYFIVQYPIMVCKAPVCQSLTARRKSFYDWICLSKTECVSSDLNFWRLVLLSKAVKLKSLIHKINAIFVLHILTLKFL